ncbi:threonine ammonia-lyase [Polymorphospora rubra]|uniref:Threonine ammonia-lyase n=1 Tax=Polymorphospora rubra TaxID=338584 RepID=A0A810N8I1_9ACTN|nr:pyridoxal-phosphate dependent enzyme [Polymorphospora rubra]BCJ68098.1 threonine ammonia-lyase [Polymorphospora rubra]
MSVPHRTEPSVTDVHEAAAALAPHLAPTPVVACAEVDAWAGAPVRAKAEVLQPTGSFKVRGALNRIRTLSTTDRDRGLITVSAGNAALGAAHAARLYGAGLTVVMAQNAVREKVEAVASLGATVITAGVADAAAAFARAARLRAQNDLTFLHPFDDPMVIAGAATATLEFLDECPDLTRLYVPCSGGGLLAGAVLAMRAAAVDIELIAVQPDGSASLATSLAAGEPRPRSGIDTIVDALTAPAPGFLNLRLIASADVRVVTVPDGATLAAMAVVIRHTRLIVEPAGAIAVAAVKADVDGGRPPSGPVGVLLSGGNASGPLLATLT